MRLLLKILLLVLFFTMVSACGSGAGSFLFLPEVSVTPATAPVSIPGVTPPAVSLASTDGADLKTLNPVRTPIRLKIPANPVIPTETPTPLPAPVEADTPTPLPVIAPTDTPFLEIEEAPTLAPTEGVTESSTVVSRPLGLDHTLNVLIVGSDERYTDRPWRSDVIMVAAVDFANREVGVVSFPRDLWVQIPTVGENRINTATFWGVLNKYPDGGGIGLLADTIE